MSLLKNIRRHKAFGLKRLVQTHGGRNRPVSMSTEKDGKGEAESEDEDGVCRTGAVQEAYSQYANSPKHEGAHMRQQPNPSSPHNQPALCGAVLELYSVEEDTGKEGSIWPHLAKTLAFLVLTAGAFSVGKVAAIGITLTAAMFFKYLARQDYACTERLVSTESGDLCSANVSLPSSVELLRPDRVPALADISNVVSVSPPGNVIVDANCVKDPTRLDGEVTINAQMDLLGESHGCTESAGLNVSGENFLPQRKKLKRLNCIELPHASSCDEEGVYSPFSSSIHSPRTWFQSGGSSQQDYVTGSTNMHKHFKSKSKDLLRRLRKKENQSEPSSQIKETDEGSHVFCLAAEGSETERTPHSAAASESKEKFKTACPGARDGSPLGNFDILRGQKQQPAVMSATGTSKETAKGIDMYECQSAADENASSPGNSAKGGANATIKRVCLHEAFLQRRRERKQSHAWIGPPGIVLGISITMIGLLMGRIAAIGGLVCYWYALSLKLPGAATRRK